MLTINRTGEGELLRTRWAAGSTPQARPAGGGAVPRAEEYEDAVFDLQDLRYITTADLRVLLSAQKRINRQGRMRLANVGEAVCGPSRSRVRRDLPFHGLTCGR